MTCELLFSAFALDGIRTVPISLWVEEALNRWTRASGIKDGCLFRAISKSGKIWGEGMTPKVLLETVKRAAEAAGIEKLPPHDLRRTCARLCHLGRRRVRPDPVSPRPRVHPDDGTFPRLQARSSDSL